MYLNDKELAKVYDDLREVAEAIIKGVPVLVHDPVDGWVATKQLNLYKSPADYRIGEK